MGLLILRSAALQEYWWDELTPDFIVDPARSTDGTGSEASPYQPSQAFALDPGGQQVIFEYIPGNLDYTDDRSTQERKYPLWQPAFSGTPTGKIIHRTRYKAIKTATLDAQKTKIRRVGGSGGGSIFGVGSSSNTKTDIILDGFEIPTWTGIPNAENYQLSLWNAERCSAHRMIVDGESAGVISGATNVGGVWSQGTYDCEFSDLLVRNIGSASGLRLWSGFEFYSIDGLSVHHVDVETVIGRGIMQKGQTTFNNRASRFHHNRVSNCDEGLWVYNQETGLVLPDAAWLYQNIVTDCQDGYVENVSTGHNGVAVVNNLFARCSRTGYYFKTSGNTGPLQVNRNNIYIDNDRSIYPENGSAWNPYGANHDMGNNRHFGNVTSFTRESGQDRTLAYVQGTLGNCLTDTEGDPLCVDKDLDDFRLEAGSPCRNAGTDYLQLLGGLSSASINIGPYITADMSDQIGARRT